MIYKYKNWNNCRSNLPPKKWFCPLNSSFRVTIQGKMHEEINYFYILIFLFYKTSFNTLKCSGVQNRCYIWNGNVWSVEYSSISGGGILIISKYYGLKSNISRIQDTYLFYIKYIFYLSQFLIYLFSLAKSYQILLY